MNPADHFKATIGADPLALVDQIEAAAKVAGRARADASRAEHKRKSMLAALAEDLRAARLKAGEKVTETMLDNLARASPRYASHLDELYRLEVQAADDEAHYYALRNRQDWLHKAADASRAEAYLSR